MLRAVSDVPVIVATARDDEAETVARARRRRRRLRREALRRSAPRRARPRGAAPRPTRRQPSGGRWSSAACASTPRAREAALDGRALELTRLEFDLLAHLAARAGHGRQQEGAAGRRLARAVRRRGQDRRRAPVVAAAQARRVGRRAALPAQRARGRREAGRARGRRRRREAPARRCWRRPPPCSSWWRSCCRSRCCCARSPPTARSRRRCRRRRASRVLVAVSTRPTSWPPAVSLVDSGSPRAVTVYLPDGRTLGAPAGPLNALAALGPVVHRRRRRRPRGLRPRRHRGRPRRRAVLRPGRPAAAAGCGRRSPCWPGSAPGLLLLAVLVADRLARGTVRPVTALADAARRLSRRAS